MFKTALFFGSLVVQVGHFQRDFIKTVFYNNIFCLKIFPHINNKCYHYIMDMFINGLKALNRYFNPVSKIMANPEGQLSKTLPSATIKDANEVAL